MKQPNIYYLITAAVIVIALKLSYRTMNTEELAFILVPVAHLMEVSSGEKAQYIPGEGYYFAGPNIIINKSCSGVNFLCICFFLLCFVAAGYPFKRRYAFYLCLFPVLFVAYGITLFVNFSRILFAVLMQTQAVRLGITLPGWMHLAEGTFVYLFSLILIYLLTHILFTKLIFPHEKSV